MLREANNCVNDLAKSERGQVSNEIEYDNYLFYFVYYCFLKDMMNLGTLRECPMNAPLV